ncbi:MAG: DUF1015 domain-containing protein [Actinobacteria bacterium]|nr:DUF1015 domain-containing protein [Actinomycetota bacterium]
MSFDSIRPLRGTLYRREVVGDMARVIAPPYDVIGEEEQKVLLARSPYNIVRLILPLPGGAPEFWDQAAALFSSWKREGVLGLDDGPGVYVYRQTFAHPASGTLSRTGLLAAVRCTDLESGMVLPHERTFPRTRSQRLSLLRACRANFSQVFMVFRDPAGEVLELIERAVSAEPFLAFRDCEGMEHELWRMGYGAGAEEICRRLEGRRLIIADGHHRYETALAYAREDSAAYAAGHPRAFVSAVLFRSEDPGLLILPVHRVLRRLPLPARETVRRLDGMFEVERVDDGEWRTGKGMPGGAGAETEGGRPVFHMLTREGAWRLVLREGVEAAARPEEGSSARWRRLDVSLLHSLVFGEALGMEAGELAEKGELFFTPWEEEVAAALEGGAAEAAFMLRATSMEEIWEIAEGGERMPHKSSYFHPKLPSGLVVYDHETAFP